MSTISYLSNPMQYMTEEERFLQRLRDPRNMYADLGGGGKIKRPGTPFYLPYVEQETAINKIPETLEYYCDNILQFPDGFSTFNGVKDSYSAASSMQDVTEKALVANKVINLTYKAYPMYKYFAAGGGALSYTMITMDAINEGGICPSHIIDAGVTTALISGKGTVPALIYVGLDISHWISTGRTYGQDIDAWTKENWGWGR